MSVAILLVTHEPVATDLLSTTASILNSSPENVALLEVPMDHPVDEIINKADALLNDLDSSDGLLILTDLIGSTPYNVATSIKDEHPNSLLVSGVNLPMMLKVSNYRELSLEELAEKAVMGGQDGISIEE